jgi:hypothetical protein
MRHLVRLFSAFFLLSGAILGCSSTPEQRKAEADAKFKEEKVNMMGEYNKCVKKYMGDAEKLKSCEAYIKGFETMRGQTSVKTPEKAPEKAPETTKEISETPEEK